MRQGTTRPLKQKALEEAKRMLVITAYVWVLYLFIFEAIITRDAFTILTRDAYASHSSHRR
jgi:hypothetical protein